MESNKKYLLSVVIINYRTADLIIDCLNTLLPEVMAVDSKIVIVDNDSGDNSVAIIKAWLRENDHSNKVELILSDINSGFSGGNNTGIKAVEAEFYLLLNSDTLVRKDAIKILLKTAQQYPKAGLISPRLEWVDGTPQESCFRFITPFNELIISANTGVVTKFLKRYEVPISVTNDISFPDWTSFACVMVRADVFHTIGYMDDEFFMYFEDAEFSFRAKKYGWRVVNNPMAKVVHLRGGSSPVKQQSIQGKRLPKYYYESRTRYFYKIYGRFGLMLANLLWWLGRIMSKIREIFGRKVRNTCERQWLDIWTNWSQPQRKFTKP